MPKSPHFLYSLGFRDSVKKPRGDGDAHPDSAPSCCTVDKLLHSLGPLLQITTHCFHRAIA